MYKPQFVDNPLLSTQEWKSFITNQNRGSQKEEHRQDRLKQWESRVHYRGDNSEHVITIRQFDHGRFDTQCSCGFKYKTNKITTRGLTYLIRGIQAHLDEARRYREFLGHDSPHLLIKDNILGLRLSETFTVSQWGR